jgi:hypothetical protein
MPDTTRPLSLTEPGSFVVGCNYWASHAGTAMWRDWRPDVVESDFRDLAAAGLEVLRVFLLWPDFQPITELTTANGVPVEVRHGESPLPDTDAGTAGLSEEALGRFQIMADAADRYDLKLVVGLVTGWMSGRLYVPQALERRNVLTDPMALKWEVRLIRAFVRRFRAHPAILAWDLGNECNCMAPVPSSDAAWLWTSAIAGAAHAEDPGRPVVSGMHGLLPDPAAPWRIPDQAELTDVLTTHPYPYFTPHCDQDPVTSMRTLLHSTAESRFYADIGGRPCLAEEIGTLGPMVASDEASASFARAALVSLWAHDCHGLLWWCAFDQNHLEQAPYDWHAYERELGLFRTDRSAKPVVQALSEFRRFLDGLPVHRLPPRRVDAVCILTHGQDTWGAAYAAFVLAKQAGFDLAFQHADQPLRDAPLYLVPSIRGGGPLSRRLWLALREKVRAGATLYLSHDDGMVSSFAEVFGLCVESRTRRVVPARLRASGLPGVPRLTLPTSFRLDCRAQGAEVLAAEDDGNPALSRFRLGLGDAWFLSVPLERAASETPGFFHGPAAEPWWKVYGAVAAKAVVGRALSRDEPRLGITEHPLDGGRRVAVLLNYGPDPLRATVAVEAGWRLLEGWRGPTPVAAVGGIEVSLDGCGSCVFTLSGRGGGRDGE